MTMNFFAVAALLTCLATQPENGIAGTPHHGARDAWEGVAPGNVHAGTTRPSSEKSFDIKVGACILPERILPGDTVIPRIEMKNFGPDPADVIIDLRIVQRYDLRDTVYRHSICTRLDTNTALMFDLGCWAALEGEYFVSITVRNQTNETQFKNIGPIPIDVLWRGERQRVIIELFTALWCPSCKVASLAVQELYFRKEPVAAAAYHLSDAFATPQGNRKASEYRVTAVPTVVFNGCVEPVSGSSSGSTIEWYRYVVDSLKRIGSPLRLSLTVEQNSVQTFAHATITSLSPIRNPNLVIEAVVTESHIPYVWRGQSEINHVLRSFAVDRPDCPVDLTDRIEQVDLVLTNVGTVNPANSELLVYVRDNVSREIYDGVTMQLNLVMAPIRSSATDDGFDVYPNPASPGDELQISCAHDAVGEFQMFDLLGRQVTGRQFSRDAAIQTDGLPSGLYFLRLQTDTEIHIRKVLIR